MRAPKHRTSTIAAALALALALPAAAQDSVDARRQAVDKAVVKELVAFARRAESYKAHARARKVYELILDHYDSEHPAAMRALGYKKVGDEWQEETPLHELPKDAASERNLRSLKKLWTRAGKKAGKLHGDYGIALLAEGADAPGRYQLERAVTFDPEHRAAHEALGHEQLDGFWGDEAQLAFVRRMRAIHAKADELAQQDFDVQRLDAGALPPALAATGLSFEGARSEHFETWAVESYEDAAAHVLWSERAWALYGFLSEPAASDARGVDVKAIRYVALVRTDAHREQLIGNSPATRGNLSSDQLRMVGGNVYKDAGGTAEWAYHDREHDADRAVAHVTKRCFAARINAGLSEGMVHAMTWLLCDSLYSHYMGFAHTSTGKDDGWQRNGSEWSSRLAELVDRGEDWPLVQVPRERMENFRDPCRGKAWSFMRWLVARHPDKWFALALALAAPNLQEDDVRRKFEDVLGRSVGEVEAEWREWARDGSPIGRATQR